jgi:DNA (cytosine-5)-methyltransferase 1
MNIGSLFSGYLGLDLAVEQVFNAETAWTSDIDEGACKIIAHRTTAPNLGDITKINWAQVEPVDILTGGFPCQDLSMAGRRAGMRAGTRSGLWEHMAYAIYQLRPRYVIAENVRGLLSGTAHSDLEPCPWCVGDRPDGHLRALGAVLGDLANLGYDAQWYGLRAADIGAAHGRFRVFILATDTQSDEQREPAVIGPVRDEPRASARGDTATAQDADSTIGGQRRVAAPGQAEAGRPRADAGRRGGTSAVALLPTPTATPYGNNQSATPGAAVSPSLDGIVQLLPTPNVADVTGGRKSRSGDRSGELLLNGIAAAEKFGQYAAAVARWQPVIGRAAPAPTIDGRLSPQFVEWLMGLPEGWVTDVPGLTRSQQLKALGNGVVPQQAAAALRWMLTQEAAA